MSFDVSTVLTTMLKAAEGELGKSWKTVQPFAKIQFQNIAQTIASIREEVDAGTINKKQAKYLLSIQKHATTSAMLAVEGLGIVAAENAINSALDAVKGMVNTAIGFTLL